MAEELPFEELPFKERIKTLSFPRKTGQSERRPVTNELTGKIGGYQIEHWDGSQDAEVRPDSINLKTATQES